MKTLRPICAMALLALLAAAPQAKDEPAAATAEYLIYFNGARLGWIKNVSQAARLDDRDVVHEREEFYIQIRRDLDNSVFETSTVSDTWFAPDGATIRKVESTTSGRQKEHIEVTYAADHAVITHTIDKGKPTVAKVSYGDHTVMCESRAWRMLKTADRLKAGEELSFHSVSISDHTLVEQIWTVTGRTKRELSDGTTVEGTEVRFVKSGHAGTMLMGDDDHYQLYEDAAGFKMERTTAIPKPFKAEAIKLRSTMKANRAIKDEGLIANMVIQFDFEHDDAAGVPPLVESDQYHDVLKLDDGFALRLKARKLAPDFAAAYPLEVPEEIQRYLQATPLSQSNDPVLAREAAKLADGRKSSIEVARAIMRFVADRLTGGSGSTGSASARQAYDERAGDCTEHAALFVALARAAGLPARNVTGLAYRCFSTNNAIFGYHAWAEVWLGEWVPVDSTVRELGTSARYVFFSINEPGETYGSSRLSRCLRQGIEPVINSYELETGTKWSRRGAPVLKFD